MADPVRRLWRSRFARRLTAAFVATAVAATALTALLVNLAIDSRFEAYLDSQRQARAQQIVDEYRQGDAWRPGSLVRLAPAFVMSGAEVDLFGGDGRRVWSTVGLGMSAPMNAMHQQMMGTPTSAAAIRLPARSRPRPPVTDRSSRPVPCAAGVGRVGSR